MFSQTEPMATVTLKLLTGLVLLLIACAGPALPARAAEPAEITLWETVRDSDSSAELQLFLEAYPNSRFAPLAKLRLRRLLPDADQGDAVAAAGSVPSVPPHRPTGYAGFEIRLAKADLVDLASPSFRPKLLIPRVFSFGAAAKAGFLAGDRIVTINGYRPVSVSDAVAKLKAVAPGDTIDFRIERDSETVDISMESADRFALLWKAAHAGNSLAMSFLADEYRRGETVDVDRSRAAHWMEKALPSGDPYVLFAAGYYTELDRYDEWSDTEARALALDLYLRAAKIGEIDAFIAASRLLAGNKEDRALGLAWRAYQLDPGKGAIALFDRMEEQKRLNHGGISRDDLLIEAAESGNTEALLRIGMGAAGAGLSPRQSFGLIRRAAVWGHARAQLELGERYRQGAGTIADPEAALTWFRQSAANGFGAIRGQARTKIGLAHFRGTGTPKNLEKAYQWFEAAAQDDNVLGHFYVAYMAGRGMGTTENQQTAVTHFLKAAELGDTDAMVNLAYRYMNGHGTTKDAKSAEHWFNRAVRDGNADGHCGLGDLYYYGAAGYRQSYKKAAETYRKGVDEGMASCQFNLGFLYEHGQGMRKNRREAIRMYRLAAEHDSRAVDQLKLMGAEVFDPEAIQQLLAELGYDPGPVDGKPGKRTRAAIRAFQQSEGLAADGKPSTAVLERLRAVASRKNSADRQDPVANHLDTQDIRALSGLEDVRDL
ncbi:MAG: peptidoglycan-binding protein [Alphaproteobacteria bacterium]|nr:peptidoglycan-binding protein [Alphaproteobacteria bacterium]